MDHDPRIIAIWLRRLPGQICRPAGLSTDQWHYIRDNRLAEFHEWPSGHYAITDRGRDYLQEHGEED